MTDKNTIAESYRGFFQIFGRHNVNLMFSRFKDYFQTRTGGASAQLELIMDMADFFDKVE